MLESVLLRILDGLASVLDGIDSGRPAGVVYEECRLADRRLALVGRIWEWFRAKFDQRDNPVFSPLLAAADEVAFSCYAGVFRNVSGRWDPGGLVPLPYIEFSSVPISVPQDSAPPGLRPPRGDEMVTRFLAELGLPVIGLPLRWVETPWRLLFLGHVVGHQIQLDLAPGLVPEFGELVAATAGDQPVAMRWKMWSKEIFADLCLLCIGGPRGIWSVVEQDLADQRTMLADRGAFPSPVARLELLAAAAAVLGVDSHAGLRGIDLRRLAADVEGAVASDLALAPLIAAQALSHRLVLQQRHVISRRAWGRGAAG